MRDLDLVFERLAGSPFRRRFRLGPKESAYLHERGLATVLDHARDFIGKRLAPAEAVSLLLAMPRIEGWRDGERVARLFEQSAAVADAVPVLEVTIPWGPPFAADVGAQLVDEITRVTHRAAEPSRA